MELEWTRVVSSVIRKEKNRKKSKYTWKVRKRRGGVGKIAKTYNVGRCIINEHEKQEPVIENYTSVSTSGKT